MAWQKSYHEENGKRPPQKFSCPGHCTSAQLFSNQNAFYSRRMNCGFSHLRLRQARLPARSVFLRACLPATPATHLLNRSRRASAPAARHSTFNVAVPIA